MSSKTVNDSKNECQNNPSCHMFYDRCGKGDQFKFCNGAASVVESGCGSVLYGNGNVKTIKQ